MATDSASYHRSGYTPEKQRGLSALLGLQLRLVDLIARKHERRLPYLYYDLHAGRGVDPVTLGAGSPLVFLQIVAQFSRPIEAYFYERDPETFRELEKNVNPSARGWRYKGIKLVNADHNQLIPELEAMQFQPHRHGLVYADPSNGELPVELLQLFNVKYPKVDIAFNIESTTVKRVSRAFNRPGLLQQMQQIGKAYWLVRQPCGMNGRNWTIIFGTNWAKFPDYKRVGFFRVDTPEGHQIMDKLNLTEAERRQRGTSQQLTMF